MILRGAFWVGLVWLCMPHAPVDAHTSCTAAPACMNKSVAGNRQLQAAVFQRLDDLRIEIRDNSKSPGVSDAMAAGDQMRQVIRLLPGHPALPALLLARFAQETAR